MVNNNLFPLVLILIAAVLFTATSKDKKNSLLPLMVVVLFVVFFCGVDVRERFTNFAPVEHKLGECGGKTLKPGDDVSALDTYGNLKLKSTPKPNFPLVSNIIYPSPVGEDTVFNPDNSEKHPSVDGCLGKHNRMSMFAHNQARPECCPSTFSGSTGCVCLTDKQRALLTTRGGNKPYPGYPDI